MFLRRKNLEEFKSEEHQRYIDTALGVFRSLPTRRFRDLMDNALKTKSVSGFLLYQTEEPSGPIAPNRNAQTSTTEPDYPWWPTNGEERTAYAQLLVPMLQRLASKTSSLTEVTVWATDTPPLKAKPSSQCRKLTEDHIFFIERLVLVTVLVINCDRTSKKCDRTSNIARGRSDYVQGVVTFNHEKAQYEVAYTDGDADTFPVDDETNDIIAEANFGYFFPEQPVCAVSLVVRDEL